MLQTLCGPKSAFHTQRNDVCLLTEHLFLDTEILTRSGTPAAPPWKSAHLCHSFITITPRGTFTSPSYVKYTKHTLHYILTISHCVEKIVQRALFDRT